jgi:hypothetical protein
MKERLLVLESSKNVLVIRKMRLKLEVLKRRKDVKACAFGVLSSSKYSCVAICYGMAKT